MMDLIPLQDLGTAAGEWAVKPKNENQYAAVLGTNPITTTVSVTLSHIIAESTSFTGSGITISEIEDLVSALGKAASSEKQTIGRLREVTGLTWEQLATVFEVSRRTVHLWDSGSVMNSQNEEKLARIFNAVKFFETSTATDTRRFLLTGFGGSIPLDLLKDGKFDEFEKSKAQFIQTPKKISLSDEEILARTPLSPEILIDAKNDRVHTEKRKRRAIKVKKIAKV